jgi:hypothetical protein
MKSGLYVIRDINDYLATLADKVVEPRSRKRSLLLITASIAIIATLGIWTLVLLMWRITNLTLLWITIPVTFAAIIESWWILHICDISILHLRRK